MFELMEFIDVIVMTLAVGFIFMDLFVPPGSKFNKKALLFAILVTAPAIIFHELGHKLIALAFGYTATFHAAYIWLAIGVALKLMRTGFIFFVPGYVSIGGAAVAGLPMAMTALAGPAINAILFLTALGVLKYSRPKGKTAMFWIVTKQINGFLFVFNMLPIPLFDGFKVYSGLYQWFVA